MVWTCTGSGQHFGRPTITNWLPRFVEERIDEGMRKGIPDELWKIVVTVYDDGDKIAQFLGNENGRNARVVAVDENGKVIHFYDRGFSVAALKELADFFPKNPSQASIR